jgi:threonine/homoserine/homoserine lactone efflux protein
VLITPDQLAAFLLAAIAVTLSPGPDVLGTLSIGLSRGWKSALGFGTGCGTGCLLHTTLAALGVSAMLATNPAAFTAIKWCGAAYLAWLGWGAIRSHGAALSISAAAELPVWRYFLRGLIANAINPKVTLFFLSFLGRFVTDTGGHPARQMLELGLVFTVQAIIVFAVIGYFSGQIGGWMQRRPRAAMWLDRAAGVVFLVLAALLLWPESAPPPEL